jgi:P4 family phage/plasmid primase-like protien
VRDPITKFAQWEKPKSEASHGNAEAPDNHECLTPDQLKLLLSALDPANYRDYGNWLTLMMACHHATGGKGREEFIQFSIADPRYANDREEIGRAWDGLQLDRPHSVTIGTLYQEVKQAGRADLVKQVSDDANALILSRSNWPESARKFIARIRRNLRFHNSDWLDYCRGAYRDIEDDAIKAESHKFLDGAKVRVWRDGKFVLELFEPNNKDVAELVGALRRETHVSREALSPPCWLPGHAGSVPKSEECISFPNGILHLPSGEFYPPTPDFFTRNAVEFDYGPNAPEPKVWFNTLNEWWPSRENGSPSESVPTLQEIMGYLLVPDTSQQKMFFVLGPPRSGKGVISRVLTQLVGQSNAAFPSMSSLGGEFGRMPLIGKQLAVISELKVGRKDDPSALAAILLAISGEDNVSVNRKNKTFWEGKLAVRFLFLGNSIPKFADDGTALGNRLVILRMSNSFLGKEDLTLEARIKDELPGILNWAIAGWRRLRERGHFAETVDGLEAKAEFIRLASPVLSFVSERCTLGPEQEITKQEFYDKYKEWCSKNGRLPESKEEFGAALVACCAGRVRDYRPEERLPDGTVRRPHKWRGIGVVDAQLPF